MPYGHLHQFLDKNELQIFELVPTPTWIFDLRNYQFWWCNQAGLKLWSVETIQDMIDKDMSGDSEGTRRRMEQVFEKAANLGESNESWTTYPDGIPKTVYMRQRAILLGEEKAEGILAFISEDVDMGNEPEHLMLIDATRYTSVNISIFTFDGNLMRQNPAAANTYGTYKADATGGHPLFVSRFNFLAEGLDRFENAQSLKGSRQEHLMITRGGPKTHMVDVRVSRNPLTGDHNIIVTEDDVSLRIKMETELKEQRDTLKRLSEELSIEVNELVDAEREITHLATHDQLTGLPNRTLFSDRLAESISATHRTKGFLAVLFIDLDGFKAVNDTLGHHCGDMLLKHVGGELQGCIRETDTVARFAGDEFIVLLTNLNASAVIEKIARNMLEALSKPFEHDNKTVEISASIGIACSGKDGNEAQELLQRADAAMYEAKRGGKNSFVFASPTGVA